jgi:hypothetical protein
VHHVATQATDADASGYDGRADAHASAAGDDAGLILTLVIGTLIAITRALIAIICTLIAIICTLIATTCPLIAIICTLIATIRTLITQTSRGEADVGLIPLPLSPVAWCRAVTTNKRTENGNIRVRPVDRINRVDAIAAADLC